MSSTTRSNKQKKKNQQQGQRQSGMKVGAVSLWLLILLSERPMYGYEIIKELAKRFAGYWKPKTGTIYPALERLEQDKLVTSQRERKRDMSTVQWRRDKIQDLCSKRSNSI